MPRQLSVSLTTTIIIIGVDEMGAAGESSFLETKNVATDEDDVAT